MSIILCQIPPKNLSYYHHITGYFGAWQGKLWQLKMPTFTVCKCDFIFMFAVMTEIANHFLKDYFSAAEFRAL